MCVLFEKGEDGVIREYRPYEGWGPTGGGTVLISQPPEKVYHWDASKKRKKFKK